MAATCKSCNAPIIWCKTTKGKSMPLDAEPSDDGTFVIANGVAMTATASDGLKAKHKSHFATCPNSDKHRKPKEAPSGQE